MSEHMPLDNLDTFEGAPHHPIEPGVALSRQLLSGQLKARRLAAGLTQGEVALHTAWSTSKIIRMESGETGASFVDTAALLDLYGLADGPDKDTLLEAARSNKRQAHRDKMYADIVSGNDRRYFQHEASATSITVYDATLVPDFLRTEAYAQSLTTHASIPTPPDQDEGRAALRAQLRRERAAYLLGPGGPAIRIIIDEGVFWRPIGNEGQQPEHLYDEVATVIGGLQCLNANQGEDAHINPNVTVQVAPFTMKSLIAQGRPFSILSLPGLPGTVQAGWPLQTTSFGDAQRAERYQGMFDRLSETINGPEDTNGILNAIQQTVREGRLLSVLA
jgi:hypothetical protein